MPDNARDSDVLNCRSYLSVPRVPEVTLHLISGLGFVFINVKIGGVLLEGP